MTEKGAKWYALIGIIQGGLLLLANFLGAKIWHLGPIVQDGGVIVFPLIYIAADLAVELYGERKANHLVYAGAALNLIAIGACLLVDVLPDVPGAGNVALSTAFGLSLRIMLASVVGFVLSQMFNNWLFEKIREKTQGTKFGGFWARALGSSLGAHILDSTVFNLIAFFGRTEVETFLAQVFWAIVVSMAIETLLNPLTALFARLLAKRINATDPPR